VSIVSTASIVHLPGKQVHIPMVYECIVSIVSTASIVHLPGKQVHIHGVEREGIRSRRIECHLDSPTLPQRPSPRILREGYPHGRGLVDSLVLYPHGRGLVNSLVRFHPLVRGCIRGAHLWCMVYGVWCMVYSVSGVLTCGIWCMVYGECIA
jgi:hypothetical protein